LFVLWDQHRGHYLEVEQVNHVAQHAKDVLHMAQQQDQAEVGKKSGHSNWSNIVIEPKLKLNDIQMKSKRDHPQMTSHIFGPSSHLSYL